MQTKPEFLTVTFDGTDYKVQIIDPGSGSLEVTVNGIKHVVSIGSPSPQHTSQPGLQNAASPKIMQSPQESMPAASPASAAPQSDLVSAPMPGDILEVSVQVGDQISVGQKLLVLEAMKMKNVIRSPQSGKVTAVEVSAGQSVKYGDPLIRFG